MWIPWLLLMQAKSTNPEVNAYVTVNHEFLKDGNTAVLLHEFSHNFGLIDYYDVTYSGINAVGGFDMQSDNVGDWNAYSKLAAGWMDPQVVTGLASGESVELTLTSSALTDDLFYAGDTFTVEDYDEFFYEGLMDDGERFGYTISIVSIGEKEDGCPYAVVRIMAQ